MAKSNQIVIVGFDAAWSRNNKGAICAAHFVDGRCSRAHRPRIVGYDDAIRFINEVEKPGVPLLVALDQPTIVPNLNGSRPVDKVAASVVSFVGGGVQPASRAKTALFGDDAPVWEFLKQLAAREVPEEARSATSGRHLIEVFPALALPGMEPTFYRRKGAPRYNPGRPTFKGSHWRSVLRVAADEASRSGCQQIVEWVSEFEKTAASWPEEFAKGYVSKSDQDRLDSIFCLLIGMRWRFAPRHESTFIGCTKTGYMIAPTSIAKVVMFSRWLSSRPISE